jgi:hypothetical protein
MKKVKVQVSTLSGVSGTKNHVNIKVGILSIIPKNVYGVCNSPIPIVIGIRYKAINPLVAKPKIIGDL